MPEGLNHDLPADSDNLPMAISMSSGNGAFSERIPIRLTQKVELLPVHEVDWIEADGNYVSIHARGRSYVQRATMIEFERRLDPSMFMRVHRSRIVNTTRIKEISPLFHGEFEIILQDGTRLSSGRKYSQQVQQLAQTTR